MKHPHEYVNYPQHSHNAIFHYTQSKRNTQSKLYMRSLTEFIWDFQNNALWDTNQHALLVVSTFRINKLLLSLPCR